MLKPNFIFIYFLIFILQCILITCQELSGLIGGLQGRSHSDGWCYEDGLCDESQSHSKWNRGYCKEGHRQSPINIVTSRITSGSSPIDFGTSENSAYDIVDYIVRQNEFTMSIEPPKNTKARFKWPGKNNGIYTLAGIHFHWGPDSNSGSEHLIDGKAFSMEMHCIHFRSGGPSSYENIQEAVNSGQGDALAVVGIMLQVEKIQNKIPGNLLEPLVGHNGAFAKLNNTGDAVKVYKLDFNLHKILTKQTYAYTYAGSLTTPGCNEIVQWIVFKDKVMIKEEQVEAFRRKLDKGRTFRNIQALNGRHIVTCSLLVITSLPPTLPTTHHEAEHDIDYDYEENSNSHPNWCYILSNCKEANPSSDWHKGTCQHGKRQSPIDIQTDKLDALTRRKRRVILRKHKPKGRSSKSKFKKNYKPLEFLEPELSYRDLNVELSESESEPNYSYETSEESSEINPIQKPKKPTELKIPALVNEQKTNIPSTIEQGLMCSPQPHWNKIWVNGKAYQYWIQMHLCRLVLRQNAQFVMEKLKQKKHKKPKHEPPPVNNEPTEAPSTSAPSTSAPSTSAPSKSAPMTPTPPPSHHPISTITHIPSTTTEHIPASTLKARIDHVRPKEHKPPPVKITFDKANYIFKQFALWNNGRTMQIFNLIPESGTAPTFSWPDQNNAVYKLDSIHFHWGPRDNLGSEHTIDGKAYSAEMQLVHYRSTLGNQGFNSFQEAVQSKLGNAIATISVLLQVDDHLETSFLQPHIYNFAKVPRTGDKITVMCHQDRLRLDVVLERALEAFTYMGSFTTPKSCMEIVAWIVCKEPVSIARRDLQALRSCVFEGDYPLFMNYRSTQKHNTQSVHLIGIRHKSAS